MAKSPKGTEERLNRIVNGWQTLAPDKSFGGMTLAQFKAKIKPSFDAREELRTLESQTQSKQVVRDTADDGSLRYAQLVVNGVLGDPEEGPDSDLYESFGYYRIRRNESFIGGQDYDNQNIWASDEEG